MHKYKIEARIDAEDRHGLNVHDWFYNGNELLDMEFATMDEAGEAAKAHYKGPDINGIGCTWELVLA